MKLVSLIAGSASKELAQEVADLLDIPCFQGAVERFPDGEVVVNLSEDALRGHHVVIVQSTGGQPNEYVMELLLLMDAAKRADVCSVTVVIPYYGYSRQDRCDRPGRAIAGKLVADLLTTAGLCRLIAVDLHSPQIEGFFNCPVENLSARELLMDALREQGVIPEVVVAPDLGSVKLARPWAAALEVPFAVVEKVRTSPTTISSVQLIGDVAGKHVLLADDICSTAGTLRSAAIVCQEKGAAAISVVATHGIFSGGAASRIDSAPIDRLLVTNSVLPLQAPPRCVRWVSVASLLAKAIAASLQRL